MKNAAENAAENAGEPLLRYPRETAALHDDNSSFGQRITESPVVRYVRRNFQPGGIKSSIFVLLTATVGAGGLALPYAMKLVGLVLGLSMIVFFAFLTFYSLHCLLVASERSGKMTYNEISKHCFGDKWAMATDIVLILNLLGLAIGFLVVIKGIAGAGLGAYAPECHESSSVFCHPNTILLILTFVMILPLGLLEDLRSLSFTSLLGFFWIMFLLMAVVFYFFSGHRAHAIEWHGLEMAEWGNFVDGVPYLVYVYLCHPNVLPVYAALQRPSPRRMYKVLGRMLALAAFVYIIFAFFVYLTFQNYVFSDFIMNNFHKDLKITVGAFGFAFSLMIGTPVYIHSCRAVMDRLFFPRAERSIKRLRWFATLFMFICLAVTLPVRNLADVLSIVGASTSPIVSFVLPPAYLIKLSPEPEHRWDRLGAWFTMLFIGSISVISLVKSIAKFVHP